MLKVEPNPCSKHCSTCSASARMSGRDMFPVSSRTAVISTLDTSCTVEGATHMLMQCPSHSNTGLTTNYQYKYKTK